MTLDETRRVALQDQAAARLAEVVPPKKIENAFIEVAVADLIDLAAAARPTDPADVVFVQDMAAGARASNQVLQTVFVRADRVKRVCELAAPAPADPPAVDPSPADPLDDLN